MCTYSYTRARVCRSHRWRLEAIIVQVYCTVLRDEIKYLSNSTVLCILEYGYFYTLHLQYTLQYNSIYDIVHRRSVQVQ